MSEAVWKRGALGVVAISTARAVDYPDQLAWMRIPPKSADGAKDGTFGFVLSPREGQRLRRELAASKTPFTVSVKIDADASPRRRSSRSSRRSSAAPRSTTRTSC